MDEMFFYFVLKAAKIKCIHSNFTGVLNFGRQCHFKIWLDCHKFKKFPRLIMSMSTKCQKNEKKMTTNVIQHDDRL
jgi:hypothetical protein